MNKECPKGGQHEIGTDGMHSNRFCKKCFTNESAIYKIEWRPDDWVNPYNKEDRPLLLHDHDGRTFEAGASAMLAVRDKWWVERMEKFICEDDNGDYYIHPTAEFHTWRQSLKQSLGVKQ